MIKGSVEERLEYEEYIRSLKDSIRYPFWSIYWESQKIIRYYWIKKAKEDRDFTPNEIQILHLMFLIDVAVRIGGLLYAWWWEEYIPKMISGLSPSKAEWYVSASEMGECFMNIPTRTVEAALLKTNASSEIVRKALEAQRTDNRDALIEQLSGIPMDEIFGSYKLIHSYRQQCEIISEMTFSERKAEKKIFYTLTDVFEVVTSDSSVETQRIFEKISDLVDSIELGEENILDNPEPFISALCIGIQLINYVASDELGKFDPIAETLQEITEESAFLKIYHHYVQFPRDADRCMTACKMYVRWINENLETNISEDEFDMESIGIVKTEQIQSFGSARLEFPTRLLSETGLTPISAQEQEPAQIEGTDAKTSQSTSAVDYRIFFASQAPDIEYKHMRNIAARLAGKENVGNGIVQSQLAYIQVSDMLRFCYFFLHKICPPDNITNVDFSKPILWLGNWESLRYLVYRLYGKPKSLPSNLSKDITEAFRFKPKRQRNEVKGKIAETTFNNSKNILIIIADEDKERIDTILKEFEPFMKRQN